jgi:hypothetical protein
VRNLGTSAGSVVKQTSMTCLEEVVSYKYRSFTYWCQDMTACQDLCLLEAQQHTKKALMSLSSCRLTQLLWSRNFSDELQGVEHCGDA